METENTLSSTKKAKYSFILGIVGLIAWLIPLFGYPVTIIGLYYGIKGLESHKKIKAIIGISLSSVTLLLTVFNSTVGAYKGYHGTLFKHTTPTSVENASMASDTPAATASWHTAFTYTNNATIQTQSFTMQGTQWKITYSCSPVSKAGWSSTFTGWVYATTDNSIISLFANTEKCPTSNTSYVYAKDPGQYYLQISPDNAVYSVTVEDYY